MSKSIYAKLAAKIGNENKKIAEKAERGQFEKVEYFKPKTGENMIRLIPDVKNPENTFVVVKVHYLPMVTKDGKEVNVPLRCLEDYEDAEKCPACKEYKRLMDEGDKDAARQFRAKEVILYNILDYTNTKKILPYVMPFKAHETIMSYFEDFRESMFDIEDGRDWKLVKKVDPAKGKIFGTEYTIRPVMKESSAPSKYQDDIDNLKSLTEIYPEGDKDRTKKKMLELLGLGGADEDEEEEVSPRKAKKPTPAKNKYEDEDDEDEEYVRKSSKKSRVEEDEDEEEDARPAKKKKSRVVVEEEDEDEEEEVRPAKKKKAKVEVEEDLEDEINALLNEDD